MSLPRATVSIAVLLLLSCLPLVTGCGDKGDDEGGVLAKVGDREVTAKYYKDRLIKLEETQLPRDENGQTVDMATLAGKRRFLDVIIDKELMVAKALQMGYDQDTQIDAARKSLDEANAMGYFWMDEIGDPSKYVTDADVDYYYSRLGERRECDYLITDFAAQAEAARADALAGMPWSELVAKYHSAPNKNSREPTISVPWGQYRDEFENPVFSTEKGGITAPIPTEYGWWLLRVNDVVIDPKPDLESIKAKVLLSIAKRNENLRREDLIAKVRQQRNFQLDEAALKIVYDGLPENEPIVDPQTNQPLKQEQLLSLQVPSEALDQVLLSYDLTSGPYQMTIADFKATFDRQSAFERPKKQELLGGLRTKLTNNAERAMMVDEARKRGYFEDKRVHAESFRKIEEMLVDRVQREVITYEEYVSPEELATFWQEHGQEYYKPERRSGQMVRCADRETAHKALRALKDEGLTWKQMNVRFGNDPEIEKLFGKIVQMRPDDPSPIRERLFAMTVGEVTEPFEVPGGWAVVQLDAVLPPEQPTMEASAEIVGQRIRMNRMDAALRNALDEWRTEFGVTVNEDLLAAMPSREAAVQEAMQAQIPAAGK
ncbi:MAG TPA: peptidylprolyl isomerase [Candidatus Krumholzibacteria bacterium]|nr:peptidylprolyl isomerase [Candidatus Krumholzibacteria bacterium]HPD72318.1 peptidylprolyl isomerase [Candidatus Krumholzibacteria bacterium]HRY40750.1 peptidylprolyl isomerase [Candidatus Krumholzibacteria bacterium]